jgi:glucose-1-phosphate thymidylyltransferase
VKLKGLILAGGHGTRMRPLTHTRAKQLIPLANKPVLFYALEALREVGIEEVAMVVGDTSAQIRAAVGDGARFGVRVHYLEQDAPRGLAHAVLLAEDFVGESPFVTYLGDNYLAEGARPLVEQFSATRSDARILLSQVENPQQFGVAVLEGQRIRTLVEKPENPPSNLGVVGVYVFTPAIFAACRAIQPSARGELELSDAIQSLIARGRQVEAQITTSYWRDAGCPEDVLDANRAVLDQLPRRISGEVDAASRVESRVVIEQGACVRRSVIRGPVIIGAGAVIEDAYVGPFTSIGERCVVRGSEIEHSILLPEAHVLGMRTRVVDSLLGEGAVLQASEAGSTAMRVVLGDRSIVST